MTARESHLVELVTGDGEPAGAATVADAHDWPGRLHRAFSVLIIDADGRFLLQRRASVKTRFANRWANACCGHPAPGEDVRTAAERRLGEELGLSVAGFTVALGPAGVYVYRAADADTGRVEHEYDHVLIGRVPVGLPMRPDPAEIDELRWVAIDELLGGIRDEPAHYVPWLAGVLAAWHDTVPGSAGAG